MIHAKNREKGLVLHRIKYRKNGESIIVRPSGTEPKIKAYFTTFGKSREEAKEEKKRLAEAVAPIFR